MFGFGFPARLNGEHVFRQGVPKYSAMALR